MSRRTQALKVSQPLRAVLHYVGIARGRPGARQVGEEILLRAIREHPAGAQMLALVNDTQETQRKEQSNE